MDAREELSDARAPRMVMHWGRDSKHTMKTKKQQKGLYAQRTLIKIKKNYKFYMEVKAIFIR